MAEFLGIDLSGKIQTSYGIAREIKVKTSKIRVIIKKNHEKYKLIIPVQVILSGKEPPIILGRAGFFENFIITFNEDKKRLN